MSKETSEDKISILHGGGGFYMHKLIKEHILAKFKTSKVAEIPLSLLADSAVVEDIAFTTDSYTVKPIFFPGGDIGRLSVSGTINDLSVVGAEPLAISCALVLEEGFALNKLDEILESMEKTADEAGVDIVTGDTKVVEKGKLDEIIINTAGIGKRSSLLDENLRKAAEDGRQLSSRWLDPRNVRPGDKIIISGHIGEHALAIMASRKELGFEAPKIRSDTAPLNKLISKALEVGGVVAAKDPTRGGLAALLNEWNESSGIGIIIREESIPISEGVRAASEILGIDPLELANEGKAALAVSPNKAEEVLSALRSHPLGRNAEIIGEFTSEYEGVIVETEIGGLRYL
ncbi:MAG: hydrogenase expression/formation protein HypE, partial [Thaumarchaeota archaeon]|nr:hydrogenase expression/formation protein HypE [Nitrososphaerota archaeon]